MNLSGPVNGVVTMSCWMDLSDSDAGIETLSNNVHRRVPGPDLDRQSRVLLGELRKNSCQCHLEHGACRVNSQQPGHFAAFRVQSFDCLLNICQRGCDAGDKSRSRLCQGNAPRGACKQRDCESVLDAAHGVTDRRRTHTELSRGGREGPVASNTGNDRQMAEEVAIHSCTVSHTACHLNCLTEP